MTLTEFAAFICSKTGQTDDYSVQLCKGFVQARFRMLWDAELWRDSQRVTSATANGPTLPFPADTERVISVRCASTFLDPVDATFIVETNSAMFEATGTPTFYEDYTDPTSGVHSLRLFPHPTVDTPLLIVGKRPCPMLGDNDTPPLRTIDSALLAFAMGDMLERQRQYAKAQAKFQEAAAHLEQMRKVEGEQADRQRQNKTLSANGGTLGDLIDDVASRLGDFSPATRIRIKQLVRRAYETIWNTFLWRETLAQATVAINAGGLVILPDAMERPISVRYGAAALLATEQEILFDVEPSAFDQVGTPTSFTEQRANDGTLQVVLNPPVDSGSVVILGKRKLVPLANETDLPLLRNVAPALIALASAEMMMGASGNPASASAMKADGAAAVEDMKSLLNDQSMRARRSRSLTVAGNSLAELTDAVCARCGAWDLESVIMVKEFLRRQYQAIWDSRPWKESNVLARVATDGQTLILPEYMDRVIAVRTDDQRTLLPVGLSYLFAVNPSLFEQQGAPVGFSILTSSAVRVSPVGEALRLVSSSVADKPVLALRGEAGGTELSEVVTLNGTTAVSTAAQNYNVVLTLAKPITVGTVTVTGATSGTTLLTLLPGERERKHLRLFLHPASPNCGMEYLVLAKRRIQPLVTDSDTPLLRDCADALIHAAAGDLFTQMGKADLASDARAQAAAALVTLVDLETDQAANIVQIVPYIEPSYSWSGYDDTSWMR